MLTPTGVTSSAYWNAIKAGNPTHVRLSFENQGIVLDDSDIDIRTGLTVTDMFNGDTDLVFGRAVSKEVSTSILNTSKLTNLIWTGEFKLEMGVEINGSTNWVTIGYFSGEKPKNVTSANVIDFTAYDRMVLFDVLCDDYVSSIAYPATLKNIYDGLCAFVGIQNVAGDELPNIMNRTFSAAPADIAGYTCRDILKWIAEACGCYATINEAGKVQMVWFTDNTGHIVTGDEEYSVESADVNGGMAWDEADTYTWDELDQFTWNDVCGYQEEYAVDRIIVHQLDSDVDILYPQGLTAGNAYLISDNPFMVISSGTDLNNYVVPLYNRLQLFGGYLPVSLRCVGNWCVEAGDVITIDVNENTLSFPIFVKTMAWNGAINDGYETTGNKVREYYVDTAQKQQILNTKEIKLYVEGNYYGIKSGVAITENGVEITGSKYIKLYSGSNLDIESGGAVNIKSGANLNIKSSGTTTVESGGNFDINSGGNVNVKSGGNVNIKSGGKTIVESGGGIDVNSGGNVTVKSGGNLNVNSGGQIDINASGKLKLSGSVVDIRGSKFKVESENFRLDADTQTLQTGNWDFKWEGIFYNDTIKIADRNFRYLFSQDDYCMPSRSPDSYTVQLYIDTQYDAQFGVSNWNLTGVTGFICYNPETDHRADFPVILQPEYNRVLVGNNPDWRISGYQGYSTIYYGEKILIPFSGRTTQIGAPALPFMYGYFEEITYTSLIQASSREIKHDIQEMESYGEALDELKPVSFVYDSDPDEHTRLGLIYEDTVEVMPEICTNDESNKAINYVELIPVLLKEIQDLRVRVKELEEKEGE